MVHLYKELQPSDHFEVSLPYFLSTNERHIITLLYQPLIGIEPIQVYFTLWAEVESDPGQKLTHYHLMNLLGMPIGKIFEARIALEAIGLLRTWKKEDENGRSFIYELERPLEPSTFFQDPLLSMFLFSKIGEHAYRNLRNRFVKEKNKDEYEEVSRTFVDVFKPVHTNVPKDLIDFNESSAKDYPFYYNQFDFDLLMAGLAEQLVPSRTLTTEVKRNIAKLAFLYQLSPIEMQKIVIAAFDENAMEIPFKRLKEAAATFYKLNVSNKPPQFEKTFKQVQRNETHSKEEEHLQYLETTSPIQLLKDLANGKEPLPSTVQLVENLVANHDMPVGVVNVLLEYVMITTDMKLPQKYVERIADHWMRKNIKTAKEAMELARKERDQYNKWKQENEKKVQNYTKKNQRKEEKVPDWFYNRNESQTNEEESSVDFEQVRQRMLQKLGALDG